MPGLIPTALAGQTIRNAFIVDPVTGYAVNTAPGSSASLTALLVSSDSAKATYQYGVSALVPVALPTAFLIIQGSSTKTIRVKRLRIAGVATAQGNMQVQLSRWSTAGTLGSAVLTPLTAVKHDINDPAATATVSVVSVANYTTLGTGNNVPFLCDRVFMGVVATGTVTPNVFEFATRNDKALILRGTSDIIAVSGAASTVPLGGVLDISLQTEEDNS